MFEANSFKYDHNFDWVENGAMPSKKSSAFLHLVSRQQEIARRNSAKQLAEGEASGEIRNSKQLKPITPQVHKLSQNSNSLAVNYTLHFPEQPSAELQDKSPANLQGTSRSLRNTPQAVKVKESTTKCCCVML
jgi:hypothetical protein